MKHFYPSTLFCVLMALGFSCKTTEPVRFDVQGNRGIRGFMPENSIPGFLKALDVGVKTLEMDVVISRDSQVVVSHEPYLSAEICLRERGVAISRNSERNFNIFQMEYADVKAFDCGSKGHKDFPYQKKMTAYKPLLTQAIDSVERHAKAKGLPAPIYNIQIVSTSNGDNIFHPEPAVYANLVAKALQRKGVWERSIIQSFDVRPLKYIREKYPRAIVSLLVDNAKTPEQNLAGLGFRPNIYSPNFKLVDEKLMKMAKERNMKVVPWIVNEPADIQKMLAFGVHGIISDYPNRVLTQTKAAKPKKKA